MYRRFLNDHDYYGIISPDVLKQIVRGDAERFVQAEESAEMSIVEYLSESYEVEQELNKGKYIADYDRQIAFPVGAHVYYDGCICEVIRSMSGYKAPSVVCYWEEYGDVLPEGVNAERYTQLGTYYPKDVVEYNERLYVCLAENGYKFGDVRPPMVEGWLEAEYGMWQPVDYAVWDVVVFEDVFYTLLRKDDFDNNITPLASACWGAIADYDREYNDYEFSEHEYVVYKGRVFYPAMDVNADVPERGVNVTPHDPRNYNLKKHMVRLALYELTKVIAPNNVSVVRLRDYEDSMKWLSDAAKLRLNPQIPRKINEDRKPVTSWQMATFQRDYDPYKNPWLT